MDHLKIIDLIVVGNGYLSNKMSIENHDVDMQIYNMQHTKEIFKGTKITTAENFEVWQQYPELSSAVDYATILYFPFWQGKNVDKTLVELSEILNELKRSNTYKKNSWVVSGWPSYGDDIDCARANPISQKKYVEEFIKKWMSSKICIIVYLLVMMKCGSLLLL